MDKPDGPTHRRQQGWQAWVAQDPTSAGFADAHFDGSDNPVTAMPPLFGVTVADQKITVTAMGAVVETDVDPTDTILDLPAFAASTTNDAPAVVRAGWPTSMNVNTRERAAVR